MEEGKLHIVMVPWLAFGHMIPYLELAKSLAQMGHHVSFLSTSRNIERLPSIPEDLRSQLNLVKLIPPPIEGLPEDAQSTNDVPFDQIPLIQKLQDALEGQLCAFIEDSPFLDWIIYDMAVYRAPSVAKKYGIPSVFFGPLSAATLCFIGPPSALLSSSSESLSPEIFARPPPWIPFPTNVAFRHHEATQIFKQAVNSASVTGVPECHRVGMSFQGCQAAAVRSCIEFEIEPEWIKLLGQLYQKPVFPIGLLPPPVPKTTGTEHDAWAGQEWLETQKQGSVAYVAFGSELRLTREQVHELASGLELSELPFFWVYRGDPALLPAGFEDRTEGRGRVCFGWAPQARLLAHPSVGGFLLHGGWGSCIEALVVGKPLVMLPMMGDQGLNTRVLVSKKVGVEVPRNDGDGSFTGDALAKCLKLVMVDDEGGHIRSNAREMSKIFGDKELNNRYVEDFSKYLVEHRRKEIVSA